MFFDSLRIIENKKPKYALMENVKNLTGNKFKTEFKLMLKALENAGYNNYWQILNAKEYGAAQNRERVFIVSIRKDIDDNTFIFPEKQKISKLFKDVVEIDEAWKVPKHIIKSFANKTGDFGKRFTTRKTTDVASCITTKPNWAVITNNYFTKDFKSYTIQEIYNQNIDLYVPSPLSCWRLMGFSDEDFYKAQATGISNNQLYKQAGNSICTVVPKEIFKKLFKV